MEESLQDFTKWHDTIFLVSSLRETLNKTTDGFENIQRVVEDNVVQFDPKDFVLSRSLHKLQ